MAAGSVADDDSSDDSSPDDLFSALDASAHDHADHVVVDEDGMMTIQFSIEDIAALPVVDFTMKANPCGCVGLCEHIIDMDGFEDDLDFA